MPFLGIYAVGVAILTLAPIAIVVAISFTSAQYLSFPPPGLSLRWYAQVFTDDTFTGALRTSLAVGVLVTILSCLLGVPAALELRRLPGRLRRPLETMLLSPLMLPTIVLGIAILTFYSRLGIGTSPLMIAVGQAVIGTPYAVRLTLAGLAGVDPAIERAATNLGAGAWSKFWRVTFPLARAGIIAGALFSFIVSLDDVNIALFLSDVHTTTLPVALFSYIEQTDDPLGTAAASLLVLLALGAMFLADRFVGIEWLFGLRPTRSKEGPAS